MSAATNAMQRFDQDVKKFGTQFCRSHLVDARELRLLFFCSDCFHLLATKLISLESGQKVGLF